ncbi:MAG: acyltransferase [Cyanobacteria bacterium SZAS-4]|nr:acyltransferase [Cyanobacteria bacterium SZAS-4]
MTSAAPVLEPQSAEIALEQKPQVKKAFYLPELDGLRTVGFFYMFMAHSSIIPQPGSHFFLVDWYNVVVKWGVIGLDMFFVLSGYLITTLLLKERLKNGNISLPLYFKRRMLRIWPLFYLVIFVGAFVIPFVSTRHLNMQMYTKFLWDIFVPMFFFLGNYALIFKAWTLQALTAGLNFPLANLFRPLWSVCSEEQFYVTWPFIVRKLKSWQGLSLTIVGLTIMSMGFRYYFQQYSLTHTKGIWTPSDFYHYNTLCGLDTLMAGALIATVQLQLPDVWKKICKQGAPIAVTAFVILGSMIAFLPEPTNSVFIVPMYLGIALLCGMVLIGTMSWAPLQSFLSLFAGIGKTTYGMYLVHHPIIAMTENYLRNKLHMPYDETFYAIRFGISMTLTVLMGQLLYRTIEKRLEALRKKYARI